MVKCKVISNYVSSVSKTHDTEIEEFLLEIEKNSYCFISLNTITYGDRQNYLRTEIVYKIIPTRNVIIEKISS